jgi:hypothetical protein
LKKAHRQERLLSSTLTESLILFLFILLAIADIYAKREKIFEDQGLIPPGHKTVPENLKMIDDGQVAISISDYEKFKNQDEKIDELLKNKEKELNKLREKLVDKGGVNPPPCEFNDGSQIFFEVRFLPGKRYHLKFKNPSRSITYAGFTVSRDTELILSHKEIRAFGKAVVKSTMINKDDKFCCCDAPTKNLGSSFCTKCVYVYDHKDLGYKKFTFSRVDGPTTAEMIKTVDLFFYRK